MTRERLIERLAAKVEYLSGEMAIASNGGTFSGDPQFDEWTEYEALDGSRRIHGNRDGAPGYARKLNVPSAASRRAQIAEIQAVIRELNRGHASQPIPNRAYGLCGLSG